MNIYRAHSLSRGEGHHPTPDRDRAHGDTAILNQAAHAFGDPADWTVQQGRIEWEGTL